MPPGVNPVAVKYIYHINKLDIILYASTFPFSYFNQYELDRVVRYVKTLLNGEWSHEPVKQTDIGIISPYIRQVYKLKAKLKDKGWEDIEVGTTETYQGREKRVILVSTVRSQRDLLAVDAKFNLGFVANARVCC
jgi:superfamily I DNA and/or RNA helicase